MPSKSTILILGATGMLGHSLFTSLSQDKSLTVYGTVRNLKDKKHFSSKLTKRIIGNIDLTDSQSLSAAIQKTKPQVVINCAGLIKQVASSNEVLEVIPINTILPHTLAQMTKACDARLILVSTDCVFSGKKGSYTEADLADCGDLYGQSKLLGEVSNEKHVLTIRTSIIGHELRGGHSLVSWFLNQKGSTTGYAKAIYSGLPTIELARIIRELILPNPKLSGLYHIASEPISKFDLLALIAKIYRKKIALTKSNAPKINRSLNCERFQKVTGYRPKSWQTLVEEMHADYLKSRRS